MKIITLLLLMSIMMLIPVTQADTTTKRSKNINFEDELIEGINRKPLDSFNQISERNRKNKNHLYRKRSGFSDRDDALLSEMRLAQ
jgi:hypothetical protein